MADSPDNTQYSGLANTLADDSTPVQKTDGVPVSASVTPQASPAQYTTSLTPQEEFSFQGWVQTNKIPWRDEPNADYDMRGYWKAQQSGDKTAKRAANLHFPDTYKTPYHKTFSNESIYATADAPHWEGDRLIDKTGKVVADETPEKITAVPAGHSRIVQIGPHAVAFPDSMSEESVHAAARDIHQSLQPPSVPVPKVDMQTSLAGKIGEPIVRGAENLATGLGRVPGSNEEVKAGLTEMVKHPINSVWNLLGGMGEAQADLATKAKTAFQSGDIGGALSYGADYLLPGIGPQLAQSGEQLHSGDVAGGIGTALAAGAQVASGAIGPKPIPVAPSAETSLLLRPLSSGFEAAQQAGAKEASAKAGLEALPKTVQNRQIEPTVDYKSDIPRAIWKGDPETLNKWQDANATDFFKQTTAAHELVHYLTAVDAGVPTNKMELQLGHTSDSVGKLRLSDEEKYWHNKIKPTNAPEQNQQVAQSYLEHLLAPGVVESKLGQSEYSVKSAMKSDVDKANEFLRKVMHVKPKDLKATRDGIIARLNTKIDAAYLQRIEHATDQLTDNHWGPDKPAPGWVVEHYVNGGTYEEIAPDVQKVHQALARKQAKINARFAQIAAENAAKDAKERAEKLANTPTPQWLLQEQAARKPAKGEVPKPTAKPARQSFFKTNPAGFRDAFGLDK